MSRRKNRARGPVRLVGVLALFLSACSPQNGPQVGDSSAIDRSTIAPPLVIESNSIELRETAEDCAQVYFDDEPQLVILLGCGDLMDTAILLGFTASEPREVAGAWIRSPEGTTIAGTSTAAIADSSKVLGFVEAAENTVLVFEGDGQTVTCVLRLASLENYSFVC